jgi:lysophospholipase L1-like esterase
MFSSQTAARFRVIVDGQYVSLAETALAVTGNFSFIVLDFTAAGGRKLRHVIIESYQAGYGSATSVGPTATLQKPGAPARKMAVMADSFGVGTASTIMNCFPGYLGDLLGVPNVENNGVPATGYLANNAGANLTTRQRIVPDIVPFAPDILLITTGFNDRGMDLTALQAEVTTTMRTIRAQSALLYVPVIVCMFAGNHMTGAQPAGAAEQAIQAGVAAAADPLIYFIPTINGPNGPWLTGSGYQGATTGDGNCDIYISTDGTHPNDSGHAYLAGRLADEIARLLG